MTIFRKNRTTRFISTTQQWSQEDWIDTSGTKEISKIWNSSSRRVGNILKNFQLRVSVVSDTYRVFIKFLACIVYLGRPLFHLFIEIKSWMDFSSKAVDTFSIPTKRFAIRDRSDVKSRCSLHLQHLSGSRLRRLPFLVTGWYSRHGFFFSTTMSRIFLLFPRRDPAISVAAFLNEGTSFWYRPSSRRNIPRNRNK